MSAQTPYTDCEVRWWRAADLRCFAATGPERLKSQLLLIEANLKPSVQQTDQQQQENCCKLTDKSTTERLEKEKNQSVAGTQPSPDLSLIQTLIQTLGELCINKYLQTSMN